MLSATLILALIDALFSLLALSLYTLLVLAAAGLLRRPAARRVVDRVTGTILAARSAKPLIQGVDLNLG